MVKFEYKTHFNANVETIEALDFDLDTKNGKLTFTDGEGEKIASFAIKEGAYVKRVSK
jgi:hypothetical protein